MADKDSGSSMFDMFETMFGSMGAQGTGMPLDSMMLPLLQMLRKNLAEFDEQIRVQIESITVGKTYNPFEILGVSPNATNDEIKSAYREKAKKMHPDVGGSNAKMKELNIAYEVLKKVRRFN